MYGGCLQHSGYDYEKYCQRRHVFWHKYYDKEVATSISRTLALTSLLMSLTVMVVQFIPITKEVGRIIYVAIQIFCHNVLLHINNVAFIFKILQIMQSSVGILMERHAPRRVSRQEALVSIAGIYCDTENLRQIPNIGPRVVHLLDLF